jgi:hypothetical protein
MTVNTDPNSPMPQPKEVAADEAPRPRKKKAAEDPDALKKLELAEFFIKDLGVWDHYQKFLTEKKAEESATSPGSEGTGEKGGEPVE